MRMSVSLLENIEEQTPNATGDDLEVGAGLTFPRGTAPPDSPGSFGGLARGRRGGGPFVRSH